MLKRDTAGNLQGSKQLPKTKVPLYDRLEHTLYIQILLHLMFQGPDLLFLFGEFSRLDVALFLHPRR